MLNVKLLNDKFMNIQITRTRIKGEYCEGYLSIDGTRICDTLENANALVPSGQYPIKLVKCKQYAKKMPLVHSNAPCSRCRKSLTSHPSTLNFQLPCYCPMLKPGNGIHGRLDGSILVGEYNCLNSLIQPRTTFDPLYERIRKSISRGNQVMLTIKEPPK